MDRFWKKVRKPSDDSSCWVWTGATNKKGYGMFHVEPGVTSTAHRFSYKLDHPGEVIAEGLCVLHSCDNRRCVKPGHLRLGTPAENTKDMLDRGRQAKAGGKAHCNSKLTWQIVRNIRQNYTGGYGELKNLCTLYGVRKAAIQDILAGRTWRERE